MKKLVIFLIALLFILIIGIGIFMFYMLSPTRSEQYNEVIGYDTGSIFVTNLKDSRRFLKADIIIEIENKEDEEELTKLNYRVRDCILDILGNISEEEIGSEDTKDKLKIAIKDNLQNMLEIDSIKGIYFNEFVVN